MARLLPLAPRTLLAAAPLALLLTLAACAGDGEGPPDAAPGPSGADAAPGPRGAVPLDDFLLEPEVAAGPYAEAVLGGAGGDSATGAALFVPDAVRGLVLYYRVGGLAPGLYTLHLGSECGAEGATRLGTAEPAPTGVASGQLLLDALPSPAAADGRVLVVTGPAGSPAACGTVSVVGAAPASPQ